MSILNPGVREVSVTGSTRQEQLDQTDVVTGDLTFSEPVVAIEIINDDPDNDGEFVVNGQTISVKVGEMLEPTVIGGTQSAVVAVTGATLYRVVRYS